MNKKISSFSSVLTGLILLAVGTASAFSAETGASGQEFVELLVKEDFATAVAKFDATMKAALPEEKLRDTWKGLQLQVGSFKKQLRVRTQKIQGYDVALVTCEFEKMTLDAKVVFDATGKVAGLFFVPSEKPAGSFEPPPYANTNSFKEKEVTVGSGEWVLPGTLSSPTNSGPWAGIVLVHGSGPQDRDETVGANKPFRDLAWGLASRGIAVLRYEKRTKQYASKLAPTANKITLQEETVDDALQAVKTLRASPGINAKRVFVLGHSLGGLAAPRIALGDSDLAGLIILAGPTRPLEDLVLDQTRYLVSLSGSPSPEGQARLAEMEKLTEKVKKLSAADITSSEMLLGAGPAYWVDLHHYDPLATAKALKQPLLILQGGRDYQVKQTDFEGWKKGLSSRANVTYKLYPDLNHLFIAGEGKSTPSEYDQPGHVSEPVVSDIAAWVQNP